MAETQHEKELREAADEAGKPVDLTGPGFPPMPTEPAKKHTEAEVNKLGLTLGDAVTGLDTKSDEDDTEKSK